MDAIEKAVRNALEKGDAEDKNFRRRVYVSARHALEKSMAGKKLTQRTADDKFARLSEVAASIESEFSVAEEAETFTPLGRRVYEAAAPQVDEAVEMPVGESEAAGMEVEDAVAPSVTDAEPLPVGEPEPEIVSEAEPVESWRAADPVEEAHFDAEPAPAEEAAPEKPAKKAGGRKKAGKKHAVEEAAAPVESVSGGTDLFGKSEPVWEDVSIPATYAEEPALERAAPDSAIQAQEPDMLQNLSIDEPGDVSEEDLEDLHKLDGVRLEDADTHSQSAEPLKEEEVTARAPAEEAASDERYEVRPAAVTEADPAIAPQASMASPEPKRGWAFLFIMATLLAFFVMALWIAFSTGALKIRGAGDAPVDETLNVAPVDQPAPAPEAPVATPVADDWLMIFRPDNPGDLVVDPTIKADLKGQGPLARLRIEPAPSTTGDAAVVFSIGQGILQQVAGKKAVFDIVAASDQGKPTQISVLCDFAGLGDCGRKRYQIDGATSDNLFQIEFPAGTPEGAGEIILNPDVDGKGRALEIYAIKVRVTN